MLLRSDCCTMIVLSHNGMFLYCALYFTCFDIVISHYKLQRGDPLLPIATTTMVRESLLDIAYRVRAMFQRGVCGC